MAEKYIPVRPNQQINTKDYLTDLGALVINGYRQSVVNHERELTIGEITLPKLMTEEGKANNMRTDASEFPGRTLASIQAIEAFWRGKQIKYNEN